MHTIVIGSLNTDIIATGIQQFPKSGEHVVGKKLHIGPGGKSRNIADMIAHLTEKDSVALIGRTIKDEYGLWKVPVDALQKSGVNTDFINVIESDATHKFPGIALIPVDTEGNNQIILLPGVSTDFAPEDIDAAEALFQDAGKNSGMFALTLECPYKTALHGIEKAKVYGLQVVFDPGGIQKGDIIDDLLKLGVDVIKPNVYEAKILTDIEVTDFESAKKAAGILQEKGAQNVLITHGSNGAYLCTKNEQLHIDIPRETYGTEHDETGCGDQVTATLCAYIQAGLSIVEAAQHAITAGTMQFYRHGIQPVTKQDVLNHSS